MQERDLAKYYDERRGDLSLWSEKPAKAKVRRSGGVVFSLRFSKDELELLQARADAEGIPVSQFIRRSALEAATRGASTATMTRMVRTPDFFAVYLSDAYGPTVVVAEAKESGAIAARPPTSSSVAKALSSVA